MRGTTHGALKAAVGISSIPVSLPSGEPFFSAKCCGGMGNQHQVDM